MIFAERLVMLLSLSLLVLAVEANPPKIGEKIPSRLRQGAVLVSVISLSCALGFLLNGAMPQLFTEFGNHVVLRPFLMGLWTGLVALVLWLLMRRRLKGYTVKEQQLLVLVPIMVNVVMTGSETKVYWLSLLFFLAAGLLLVGIQERIRYAPIPGFLRGLPIQLISLLLIFLGLSFFRGVFFGEIF